MSVKQPVRICSRCSFCVRTGKMCPTCGGDKFNEILTEVSSSPDLINEAHRLMRISRVVVWRFYRNNFSRRTVMALITEQRIARSKGARY